MAFGGKIFPIRIFIDNTNSDKTSFFEFGSERPIKFRILFILDKKFKFTDKHGKIVEGYPMTLIEVPFESMTNNETSWNTLMDLVTAKFQIFENENCALENLKLLAGKFIMLPE
jgi:hypothetical protein